jgi:predicted transcriptional regulator YheO
MKTIKQVADILGVSRQAIYRRLSALPSEMLSTNDKGVQLISADGEALLNAELYEKLSSEQSADNPDSPTDNIADTLISMLQQELETKNEQLAAKDKQIEEKDRQIIELISSNKILSQSINAAHHNELAETIIESLPAESSAAPEKISLWNKIFKRKK